MDLIAPGTSEIDIANTDSSGEKRLCADPAFEQCALSLSDGKWIS